MRKIVLASHGMLAAGMKNSLEMIAGAQPQVDVLCAYTDEVPDLRMALKAIIEGLGPEDELVLVTDVLGGSVNTEVSQLRDLPRVYVMTGMNLGLVLSLALADGDDTEAVIDECLENARAQMVRIEPDEDEEDEDF